MATRNVVLSQHQHDLVESLVRSGRYQNASEVLREGLRLLERQELQEAARLAALREAVEQGWSDLAAGRFVDIDDENLDEFIRELGLRAARTEPAGCRRVADGPRVPECGSPDTSSSVVRMLMRS